MVEVASIKTDGLALEAIIDFLSITLRADELNFLHLLALPARPRLPPHEAQPVPLVAADCPQPLLVCCEGVEVVPAVGAESHPAGRVLQVHFCGLIAAHAPAVLQVLQDHLELVLKLADIVVDADALALEAEVEPAARAGFGAGLAALAQAAVPLLLARLPIEEGSSALALLLVVDQPNEMAVIPFVGQLFDATLADAEVAGLVVVDSGVEDGGVHAADIADVLQVAILEKSELVAHRTPLLGAGRHAAVDAVLFVALAADGAAQLLLAALRADGRNHLVVLADEKLEAVGERALVVLLEAAAEAFGGRSEGAEEVVVAEGVGVGDGQWAVRAEGAGELELGRGQLECEEGLAAAVRAAVAHVLRLRDAFDAEHLLAGPAALHQLRADVEADPALKVFQRGAVLDEVLGTQGRLLHRRCDSNYRQNWDMPKLLNINQRSFFRIRRGEREAELNRWGVRIIEAKHEPRTETIIFIDNFVLYLYKQSINKPQRYSF